MGILKLVLTSRVGMDSQPIIGILRIIEGYGTAVWATHRQVSYMSSFTCDMFIDQLHIIGYIFNDS